MELTLVELALIDDAIGEGVLAFAFLPVVLLGALVLAATPLRHFLFSVLFFYLFNELIIFKPACPYPLLVFIFTVGVENEMSI